MIRGLFRLILVMALLVGAGAFFLGYRWADFAGDGEDRPVATSGRTIGNITARDAREAGAKVTETVTDGAREAGRALSDAGLTAKIKAKMALDDTIKSSNIDIDTTGGKVTLSGHVATEAQRRRAVQLASETEGVKSVTNSLTVAAR
jgi:hyperosmotically inducible protein